MSAHHRSSSHIEWRAKESIDGEGVTPNRRADDIDDRIDCSNLVKMDGLDWDVVDYGFSFPQKFKCPNGHFLRRGCNFCLSDDVLDGGERTCFPVARSAMMVMIMDGGVRLSMLVIAAVGMSMCVRVRVLMWVVMI